MSQTARLFRFRRLTFAKGFAVVACAFLVGVLLVYLRVPPFPAFSDIAKDGTRWLLSRIMGAKEYRTWEFEVLRSHEWIDDIHPQVLETDPASLIGAESREEATALRQQIKRLIWKSDTIPLDRFPDEIRTNISDLDFSDLTQLSHIDRYSIGMNFGATAIAYHFWPSHHNGKFVFYHQGHYGHFRLGKPVIQGFLKSGYSVIAFSLPMRGLNLGPDPDIPNFGHNPHRHFDKLAYFETKKFSPLSFFLTPLVAVLNHLQKNHQVECVAMTGISTGGTLTSLYSAIDNRVCRSYPVAGVLPMYINKAPPNRSNDAFYGDYADRPMPLFEITNWLTIFAMGADAGRRQLQIFNQFDPCCRRGITALTYRDPVRDAVNNIGGGSFEVLIDDSFIGHKISPHAISLILDDLKTSKF